LIVVRVKPFLTVITVSTVPRRGKRITGEVVSLAAAR